MSYDLKQGRFDFPVVTDWVPDPKIASTIVDKLIQAGHFVSVRPETQTMFYISVMDEPVARKKFSDLVSWARVDMNRHTE